MAAGSISTRVPEGRPLKKFTTPPRRTIARACCQVAGLPAASTTQSGPSPSSVSALTAATPSAVSVILMVATAPKCLAISSGAERLARAAMVAAQARRGICGDHAHADAPTLIYALAHGCNLTNQFVAKNGRRLDHFGVIAALPYFQVGTVGQRQANAHQHFIGGKRRHVNHFNAKILAAIQHGCGHLRRHRGRGYGSFQLFAYFQFLWRCRAHACVIKTLRDSSVGLAARSNPSWILANGKRCVTISITGSFFFSTRSAPASWMSTAAL